MMNQFASHCIKYTRYCLGFILMLTGLNVYAGNLSASVDRDTLGLEETFILTLRYDEQINATPDYDLLRKDFDILNTQSGTQMSIINGRMEASTEWKIALAPKRIGTLLIPSFTIDGAISDAIPITISGKNSAAQTGNSQVQVEIETNKDSAYVQEQIIVTLRLYTTVGLSGIDVQPLVIKDALILQLDEKQYQTQINGRPGAVVETRYAVFPQQSGELIIPGVLYQVSIDGGQRDLWDRFYGNNRSNLLRLRTDEQRLTINPVPAEAKGQPWLPANKVELVEHWSANTNSLKVGEPITRTITIKAHGLSAGQIAPLTSNALNGLTFYSDQAQNDDQKTPEGIIGSRIETIAIVPTKAGRFTLPETQVSWWDNNKQQLQTSTLPAVTLNVSSGAMLPENMDPGLALGAETPDDAATADAPLNTELEQSNADADRAISTQAPLWLYATNLATLLLSLWLAWRWWCCKQLFEGSLQKKAQQKARLSESESDAWRQVKTALKDNNYTELRAAIIRWSQQHWRDKNLTSLQAVAQHAELAELTRLLQQLDAAVFGQAEHQLDSDALLQLLANLRRRKNNLAKEAEALTPLYKN